MHPKNPQMSALLTREFALDAVGAARVLLRQGPPRRPPGTPGATGTPTSRSPAAAPRPHRVDVLAPVPQRVVFEVVQGEDGLDDGGGHEGRVVLAGRLASSFAQRLTFTAT
jgi:hypothetical protein